MKRAFFVGLPICLLLLLFVVYRIKHPDANGWLGQQSRISQSLQIDAYDDEDKIGFRKDGFAYYLSISNPLLTQRLLRKLRCTGRLDNPRDVLRSDALSQHWVNIEILTGNNVHRLHLSEQHGNYRLVRLVPSSSSIRPYDFVGATDVETKSAESFLHAARQLVFEANRKKMPQVKIKEHEGD